MIVYVGLLVSDGGLLGVVQRSDILVARVMISVGLSLSLGEVVELGSERMG